MWKSADDPQEAKDGSPRPLQGRSVVPNSTAQAAGLGPSLVIRGTLSGEEDLVIQGQVEGEVSLPKHSVIVGAKGRVKADIFSKTICVEGQVQGNLYGSEQVTIRRSGRVRGNVTSPRVSLEDGSKFKGAIDMNPPSSTSSKRETAMPVNKRDEKSSPAARSETSSAGKGLKNAPAES